MKKSGILFLIGLGVFFIQRGLSQTFTYVGAKKCEICHKTEKQGKQYPIWEQSQHSKSFQALSMPEAAVRAKEMGVNSPPDDPKCLKCHAPLFDKEANLKAEGVSCEICHGPGSEYKKLSVMKSREEAVKNGLTSYAGTDAIKAHCSACHQNAHGQAFDFAASLEKIKHPIPGK
jgi:hypothetical protein